MGASSRKRAAFFAAHPHCCFCINETAATTIDHVPSRATFRDRIGPEGFEFPACETCNRSTSDSEQVFAFYVRISQQTDGAPEDLRDLVQHLRNNHPECLPDADLTANHKRRVLRRWGLTKPLEETYSDTGLVRVPVAVSQHITEASRKLVRALHYKHLGRRVPAGCSFSGGWSQIQIPATQEAIRLVESGLPGYELGARQNTNLGEQFVYRWGLNTDQSLFSVMAQFANSLLIIAAIGPTGLPAKAKLPEGWSPIV